MMGCFTSCFRGYFPLYLLLFISDKISILCERLFTYCASNNSVKIIADLTDKSFDDESLFIQSFTFFLFVKPCSCFSNHSLPLGGKLCDSTSVVFGLLLSKHISVTGKYNKKLLLSWIVSIHAVIVDGFQIFGSAVFRYRSELVRNFGLHSF